MKSIRHPAQRLVAITMSLSLLAIALAMTIFAWLAFMRAEQILEDELARKATVVAKSLAGTLSRAAALGIPLEKIPAIETTLDVVRGQHEELQQIAIVRDGGAMAVSRKPDMRVDMSDSAQASASSDKLTQYASIMGAYAPAVASVSDLQVDRQVIVSIDPRHAKKVFLELGLDFAVILVVLGFLVLELIHFMVGPAWVTPLRQLLNSMRRLSTSTMAAAMPPTLQGSMQTLLTSMRQAQSNILADYRDCRTVLRDRLAKRNRHDLVEAQQLASAVQALKKIRHQFGLRLQGEHVMPPDPASALGRLRLPFLLIMMAEDLTRAFIAPFAAETQPGSLGALGITPSLLLGLPLLTSMLVVALSQPLLGAISDRVCRRTAFLCGAVLAIAAHLLSAQATSLLGLMCWRALGGAAWAIVFVTAQGIVLDVTDRRARPRGLAIFVSVIMISMICAPPIGGMLADALGARMTMLVSAALAALALILAWATWPTTTHMQVLHAAEIPTGASTANDIAPIKARHPLLQPRFIAFLLLAAVPAKLILVAYCFYLVPLYLAATGSTAAMAGRAIMLYAILMVVLIPLVVALLDKYRARVGASKNAWLQEPPHSVLVALGTLLAGMSGFALLIPHPVAAVMFMALLLGIAQALNILSISAMVSSLMQPQIAQLGESVVMGYFRLVERLGSALGAVVAGALLHYLHYRQTFMAIGLTVIGCALLFAIIFWRPRRVAA
jgi:predicted MFS family arabinose efflux permease